MGNPVLYYLRVILALLLFSLAAVYGTIASLLLTITGFQYLSQYTTARFYYYCMKYLMGIDVKVIGEENLKNKPYIAICNHQSSLDVLVLGKAFQPGIAVTAKSSLKYVPVLGWFMTLSGTYFLDRTNNKQSIDTLNKSLQAIKDNKRLLWIFPEGTRSYSTNLMMLPFKKGAFHLAQQGKIPIVPIIVSNTSTILNSKWKVFNRGVITIKVLEPISTEDLKAEDVGKFSEQIREQMVEELLELGYSKAANETNLPPDFIAYEEAKKLQNTKAQSPESISSGSDSYKSRN